MRRLIQFCSVPVLLFSCTTAALAYGYDYAKEDLSGYNMEPNTRVNDGSDFSRDGHAVYFFGGYVYTYRFLSDSSKTAFNSTNSVSYIPKNVFPAGFSGLEFGVGKEWSRYVDYQMAYIQSFSSSKSSSSGGTTFTSTVKATQVLADVAFVFNPDDAFQVSATVGAALTDFNNSLSANTAGVYPTSNSTKIDPAIGLQTLFLMTKNFGVRIAGTYVADVQNTNSHGEIDVLAGLNYIL